ncbi:CaiB/BaiF CoA transferase family protein [Sinosporangium siamense]|uniref:CoA transferase n=1 Tax=Sinosporangium siamense TaxID=1367973 RepID=A0A919RNJ4_9ACTN|nr:CoA transferase [Sinosporangium siamense]GII97060.1 CoA transferase [Sinosporangium siamense]
METATSTGLLAGCLVVEVGERIAVAACGGLLAQLGADVVLVEPARQRADHKWSDRAVTAAGKRSIVVDRASADDRKLVEDLVSAADVVLLSSDLSDEDRALWGSARPGRQILCDITAFGHEGPLAGVPGSEAFVEAVSAVADTTGRRDALPVVLGAPLLEMESAVYAASAVVAALRVRRRHGFGQRVDVSLYDVAVNALATFLPLTFIGRVPTRNGNRHPTLSPWNSYRALDGWVLICAPTDEQWVRLCEAMDRPELVDDLRFATTSGRMDHTDEIDAVVGAWTAQRSVAECVGLLSRHVIPSGPVTPVGGLAGEPNLRHRGMVRSAVDSETGEAVLLPGCPVRWRGTEPVPQIPARDADRTEIGALIPSRPTAGEVSGDPVSEVRPLEGIRVVEIGMNTVGPLAGRQLGALGADVIKIEPPRGDANRHNAPLRSDGQSYIFALLNTDKRGLVLDLRQETDRQVLWDVLASADVLIENLKPGSLHRLGFGPEQVQAALPHLVYCSINGFGHDTVYPGRPALDTVVQAMSGVMSATTVDGVPTKAGISVSDQLGGLFGLLGVLAAVEHRETHGGPAPALDLAMQDGSAWATHRLWNVSPADARIVAAEDGLWLDEDGTRTPVSTVNDVLAHPQTTARGLVLDRPAADGGSWTVLGSPMRLLSTPAVVSTAMPRLGVLDPALAAEFGLVAAEDGRTLRAASLSGKES